MRIKHHHEFMWSYAKVLLTSVLKRPAFIFLGILAFTLITFFSLVIFVLESPSNAGFQTFLDSAYFTVSTMTSVGFGDKVPITIAGKCTAMIMMLLGTFIFVSFTGVVASTVLELELEVKRKQKFDQ